MHRGRPSRLAATAVFLAVAVFLAAAFQASWQQPCMAEEWVDARTAGPFVCRANFPLNGVEGLFAELAQLQDDLVRALGIQPAGEAIEIYLFRDQPSYRRHLAERFPQVPYRRALYIKSDGPGMVFAYRGNEFEVDLRHECTHALIHASLPMVPLWLDEGIAEYFEVTPRQRAYDNPHLNGLRWSARFGMAPRLSTLEKKGEISQMGSAEYRNAWAWVHFMLHGPTEAHDELVRYLADIHRNTPPGVLSQRLERRLPGLDRRFATHLTSWNRPKRENSENTDARKITARIPNW